MFLRLLLTLTLLAGSFVPALAQNYPTRAIKIIVGFGPGGVADISARVIAQKMAADLGRSVIIENLPSAGGIVAATTAARAPADGYTLYLVSNQNAVSPTLMSSLPYDPVGDFSMISTIGFFDLALVADGASPLKSVGDALGAARRDPGHFNIGTIGVGSTQYLSAALFKSMAKLDVPTVPFKSTGEVLAALKSGSVQVGFETLPAVMAQIRSGGLRALAVTSNKRNPDLPQVPTLAESGLPGYLSSSWNGLAAPAKTPPAIIALLNREIARAIADPATRKRLKDIGIEPGASSPEAFKKLLQGEIVKWRGVIQRAGIKPQ